MRVNTRLLGEIDVDDALVFHFPAGLLGLEDLKRFFLIEPAPGSPWKYLQSVEDGDLALLVADPFAIHPDYAPSLPAGDLAEMGLSEDSEAALLVVAVLPEDVREMTVNLRAPLVFNPATGQARQVVLEDDRYAVRHPVFSAKAAGTAGREAPPAKRRALAATVPAVR